MNNQYFIKLVIQKLLNESNWSQLPGSNLPPTDKSTWDIYREALLEALVNSNAPIPNTPTIAIDQLTPAQLASRARRKAAIITARAIPDWALWTQEEALTWGNTNIGTPLTNARASLPTTLTLATARAAFVVILNILEKMWVLQKANAQMVLSIRDAQFPDLPER